MMNLKARLERLETAAALNGEPETVVHVVDTDEEAAELARTLDNRSLHI
jgi:alkanesulfonate monooxygenase SsuD/methylene tetrahydromethanopterin reductase-like flavin-dependent oxidoreductase (luciferase family)